MATPINLVLSGGGARGIAHIGIIEVLEEHGFEIKAIAGTSMGALVGGVYAGQALPVFKDWLINADIKEALRMLDFSLKLPGLIKGDKIMAKIEQMLQIHQIEALPLPYVAVSTDLLNNAEMLFKQGSLIEAIRASIAIPTVFTPVFKADKMLVDGGLVNNIPINHLPDNHLPVVAVCANADTPVTKEIEAIMQGNQVSQKEYLAKLKSIRNHIRQYIRSSQDKDETGHMGYTEILDQSLHLMIAQISNEIIRTHQPALLINIPRKIAGTLDFLKAEKIYKAGRYLAEKALIEADFK